MKPSRLRTLLIGLVAGVTYAFLGLYIVSLHYKHVSISYIFILPVIIGAIPVLFSTKEQLQSYKTYLLLPWGIIFTFFFLCFLFGFEGLLCLWVIFAPFILLGSLGAFILRMLKLRNKDNQTKLYISLVLPFLALLIENTIEPKEEYYTVKTSIEINADKSTIWANVKNVKDIKANEIAWHFIHFIGIPKPLDGRLDKEGIGGIRKIIWEKGIRFEEKIKNWEEGKGFSYDINVDPKSIPPTTLDEHVMIGGKYFDVVEGAYKIDSINQSKYLITLTCKYRVSTTLNFYSRWWADFVLDDFNEMILEVIKKRSENKQE